MPDIVLGLDKLGEQFEALSKIDTIPARIEGAKVLLAGSQPLTPVDTGFLRDTQAVIEEKSQDFVAWIAIAPYAAKVELGDENDPNYPIQPYVRPAMDTYQNAIVQAIGAKLSQTMREKIGA